jgi:hypothetical protein
LGSGVPRLSRHTPPDRQVSYLTVGIVLFIAMLLAIIVTWIGGHAYERGEEI